MESVILFVLAAINDRILAMPQWLRVTALFFGMAAPFWIIVLYRKLFEANWDAHFYSNQAQELAAELRQAKNHTSAVNTELEAVNTELDNLASEHFSLRDDLLEMAAPQQEIGDALSAFMSYSEQLKDQIEKAGLTPCSDPPSQDDYPHLLELENEAIGEEMMQVFARAGDRYRKELESYNALSKEDRAEYSFFGLAVKRHKEDAQKWENMSVPERVNYFLENRSRIL